MKLNQLPGEPALGFCTNIFPGESLDHIHSVVTQHVPAIQQALADLACPAAAAPLGLGLRLSAAAAAQLREEGAAGWRSRWRDLGAYVFTVNAFPWGNFHQGAVKHNVYLPDWASPLRRRYSEDCAHVLAELIEPGQTASISSVPLGWQGAKPARSADQTAAYWAGVASGAASGAHDVPEPRLEAMLDQLRRTVLTLEALAARSGRQIVLALEPEPGCLLGSVGEAIAFFSQVWYGARNRQALAELGASDTALYHLGLCLDVCHAAVECEPLDTLLPELQRLGIPLAKIQLSNALRVAQITPHALSALRAFDDGVYLHQVSRIGPHGLVRAIDLPEAFDQWQSGMQEEWRVHCHVPLFWAGDALLGSTQATLLDALAALRTVPGGQALTGALEIETYTWDVLPAALTGMSRAEGIAREIAFVLEALQR